MSHANNCFGQFLANPGGKLEADFQTFQGQFPVPTVWDARANLGQLNGKHTALTQSSLTQISPVLLSLHCLYSIEQKANSFL